VRGAGGQHDEARQGKAAQVTTHFASPSWLLLARS
jgi:hypothetical protein